MPPLRATETVEEILALAQDAASALLATQIKADILLLLTDAPAVFNPQKWPREKLPVPSPISPDQLLQLGSFAGGSMGPKVHSRQILQKQPPSP